MQVKPTLGVVVRGNKLVGSGSDSLGFCVKSR
jgi:hypothetical protein